MSSISVKSIPLEQLLALYRQSDPEAFKEFFLRTKKFVFNYLYLKLRNRAEAEDVLQETYFKIHRHIASYNQEKKAITWLLAIAHNSLIDHVRKRRVNISLDELSERQVSQNDALDHEAVLGLRQLLSQLCADLTAEEQNLLFERIINESSYEEVAEQTGMTAVNARQKISRLLKRLKSVAKKA